MAELTADDYTYRFPDHWILHEQKSDTLFDRLNRAYVGRAIEIIRSSGAKTVLEVGCGDGWNCGQMAAAGLDVIGIDWSDRGTQYAKMFVPTAKFFRADVRDEVFFSQFDNPFDAIALIEVLEHIPPDDCVSALRNIGARMKTGGTFVLTTPSVNFPNNNPQHYQHFTAEKLRALAADAGLTVERIEGYGDVKAANAYWNKMRWVENSFYSIKPISLALTKNYHENTKLVNTPIDRCHGFIMTMTKH